MCAAQHQHMPLGQMLQAGNTAAHISWVARSHHEQAAAVSYALAATLLQHMTRLGHVHNGCRRDP
jgi:hypothetical protein